MSLLRYVCVCVCICICVYVCMCVWGRGRRAYRQRECLPAPYASPGSSTKPSLSIYYTHIYIHTYTHTHTYIHYYTTTLLYIHTYTHTYLLHTPLRVAVLNPLSAYTIHIYIHTHTHTHTQTHLPAPYASPGSSTKPSLSNAHCNCLSAYASGFNRC
jgi:hypothetical protein